MGRSRVWASLAMCMLIGAAVPAHAQLGSVNNPPPQHLFKMDQAPRLDTGLGTMAERRARLAQMKRAHAKPVHRKP
jgi:hypothetical protein